MKSSTIKKIGSLFLASAMLFGCSVDNSDTTDDNNTTDNSDSGDTTDNSDSGDTTDDNDATDNGDTTDDGEESSDSQTLYGSAGVSDTAEYTVEEMLTFAIQDEYAAHEEYVQIIAKYGEAEPFANIVVAEENHIDALTRLFETYSYNLPADDGEDHVVLPETLLKAYQTAVTAEIANIAMYEIFLAKDLPDDVRDVFEALQSASKNHLAAFERQVEKYS